MALNIKSLSEQLKEHLESEEGKISFAEWTNSIKNRRNIEEIQLERAFKRYRLNIAEIVEKIQKKYDSDKYRDFWYSKGYEPAESLNFFLYDYAEKYGVLVDDNSPIEQKQCANPFSSELYYLDGYVFDKMFGQGCYVNITKIK